MKSLVQIIRQVTARPAESFALATLVRAHGSTYRQPGARLLADAAGQVTGVLSGGCLEEEIARLGRDVLCTGTPYLASFDTRILFGCDGRLDILIEHLPPAAAGQGNVITALGDHFSSRQRCSLRTVYEGTDRGSRLIAPGELVAETEGVFLHAVPLPVRLVLFGTGPEIPPLCQLADTLGWSVLCVATPEDVPDDFTPDAQTAAVVMTHRFGRDLASLAALLPLGLPYLGLLGPRKRSRELLARLQEFQPLEEDHLRRLHTPAGLDIGSEAPEEIALSIVSEVSAVLAGRCGGFLRARPQETIHQPVPSSVLELTA